MCQVLLNWYTFYILCCAVVMVLKNCFIGIFRTCGRISNLYGETWETRGKWHRYENIDISLCSLSLKPLLYPHSGDNDCQYPRPRHSRGWSGAHLHLPGQLHVGMYHLLVVLSWFPPRFHLSLGNRDSMDPSRIRVGTRVWVYCWKYTGPEISPSH